MIKHHFLDHQFLSIAFYDRCFQAFDTTLFFFRRFYYLWNVFLYGWLASSFIINLLKVWPRGFLQFIEMLETWILYDDTVTLLIAFFFDTHYALSSFLFGHVVRRFRGHVKFVWAL